MLYRLCLHIYLTYNCIRGHGKKSESKCLILDFCFVLLSVGASLDRRSGKLIESKPKILYELMPVIYIYAINTTAGKDPKLYECPIYRKPQRTDQKYVGSIDFETDLSPRHWTLRGVALLCDIK